MLHHSFFISGYFWLECSFRFIFMQLCYVLISCFALKNIFLCKVTELTMGVKIFWICISIFQLLWFQSILNSVCYLKIRGQTKGKQGGTRILSHQDNLFPKKVHRKLIFSHLHFSKFMMECFEPHHFLSTLPANPLNGFMCSLKNASHALYLLATSPMS